MAREELERAASLIEKIGGSAQKTGGELNSMSGTVRNIGLAAGAVALGVGGYFADAERHAAAYQDSLTKVQVATNGTAAQTAALQSALSDLAVGTSSSATDMANAYAPVAGELQRIEGRSYSAATATQLLAAAQNLTESSSVGLGLATKTVADLLLVYHEHASAAASISDSLFQAHSVLGIGVERLGTMLARLQPRIVGSGVDLQHLLGIVVQMAPAVGSGQRAMMLVGGILQSLQYPAKEASKALAALGISTTDAKGRFIGFGNVLDALHSQLNKVHDAHKRAALMQMIFGHNANIAGQLVAQGSKGIEAATAALRAHGTAAQAAETMTSDAAHQMEMLPKTMEDISTTIGMVVLPALNRFLLWLNPLIQTLAHWVDANPQLAATILGVVGAVAALTAGLVFIGPIVTAIGGLFAMVLGPIGLVAAAVGGFAFVLTQSKPAMDAFGRVFDTIRAALAAAAYPFQQFVGSIVDLISGKGDIGRVTDMLGYLLHTLANFAGPVIGALADLGRQVLGWVAQQVPVLLDAVWKWAQSFVGWIVRMAPVALEALGRFGSQVWDWALQQVPVWADAAAKWIGGAAAWVQGTGIPWFLNAVYALIDDVATTISDSNTISTITAQLATWAVAFLKWATETGTEAAVAVVAWLAKMLVDKGPEIAGAMWNLASSLVKGLGEALLAHASDVGEVILLLLAGRAVLGWVGEAAVKVATFFASQWETVQLLGMYAADAIRGALAGPAAMAAATEGAAVEGEAAGTAFSASMSAAVLLGVAAIGAAAVALVYTKINESLNAQASALKTQADKWTAAPSTSLADLQNGLNATNEAIKQIGQQGRDPINTLMGRDTGLGYTLYADQINTLRAQAAEIQAEIDRRNAIALSGAAQWKQAQMTPGQTFTPDQMFAAQQSFRASERASLSPGWAQPMVDEIKAAHDQVVAEARATPGDVANAIRAGQSAVESGAAALRDAMTTPLSNARQQLILQGELNGGSFTKAQEASLLSGLSASQQKVVKQAMADAVTTGKMMAQGLRSTDPQQVAAAAALKKSITDQMQNLQNEAQAFGQNTGDAYAAGLSMSSAAIALAAKKSLAEAKKILQAKSPPGPESPLHEIDDWGFRTGKSFSDGLERGLALAKKSVKGPLEDVHMTIHHATKKHLALLGHHVQQAHHAARTHPATQAQMLKEVEKFASGINDPEMLKLAKAGRLSRADIADLYKTAMKWESGSDTAMRGIHLVTRGKGGHPSIYAPGEAKAAAHHTPPHRPAPHHQPAPRHQSYSPHRGSTIHHTSHVTLQVDKTALGKVVSRLIADEERIYAGAAGPAGGAF